MGLYHFFCLLITILLSSSVNAQTSNVEFEDVYNEAVKPKSTTRLKKKRKAKKKLKPLHVEYVRYEEHIYGQSQRSEIGDQTELDFSVRKDFSNSTFMKFGFEIDPQENSLTTTGESKVQRFDMFFNHKAGNFTVQAELELDTNKENTRGDSSVDFGGISLGFDDDSEGTFITYDAFDKKLQLGFYPFNFDSEVGDEFNTWDVARIYFIEGAPSTVSQEPSENETLNFKTIPGFSLGYNPVKNLNFSVAGGIASYLYPSNPRFDIRDRASSSNSWEKRQTVGAKFQTSYFNKYFRVLGEYAWLEKDKETGSLLKAAANVNGAVLVGPVVLSAEVGMSQAGRKPYRLARGGAWFEDTEPFLPVYSSEEPEQRHTWIGQTGFAYMAKVGLLLNDYVTPYVYYKYQDKNFIFREDESAHKLRNFNDTLSHGGLNRIGVGAQFIYNNFAIKPDIEYRIAENDVFYRSSGIQDQQLNSTFSNQDFLLSIKVTYNLKDKSLWSWWNNQGEGIYGKASR